MAQNFTYKIKNTLLETTPNDVLITMISYLTDTSGFAFLNGQNQLDTFDVVLANLSLPATGIDSYLSIAAGKAIGAKYHQDASTIGPDLISGSTIAANVAGLDESTVLVPGLTVKGTNIPDDTTIVSLRGTDSFQMSNAATGTGNSTITFSTAGWKIDYTDIATLITIIDFTAL